jgi:Ca2+-binding RTX toxin-like protein
MLITTGSGNDKIDNSYTGNNTNDYIDTGAGNDTIIGGAGVDTIDGGIGSDTVSISNIATGYHYSHWLVTNAAGEIQPELHYNSSYETIKATLSDNVSTTLRYHNWYEWITQLTLKNVENWNILAGSSLPDLLIVQGMGTTYDGGDGLDTLYADWSATTNGITWVNDPTGNAQVVNGVTIKNAERMLITTGSGNDKIDNSYTGNNTNDYIDTGAGNDTINGGAGNDTLTGGSGADTAIFSGLRTNYQITAITNGIRVTGTDGTDDLYGIETLQFSDLTLARGVAIPLADQSATEDSAFQYQIPANSLIALEGSTLTYTATLANGNALPTWLSFNPATQTFSGTPQNANVGLLSLKVTGTDSNGGMVSDLFDLTVANTNDAPTASNYTLSTNEDTTKVLTTSNFGFSDVDISNTFQSVTITTLPVAGSLKLNGIAVIANQSITSTDITAGKLAFTPAANANGTNYANFSFKVSDGTALSSAAYTMTFNVTAINDVPTLSTFALPVTSGNEDSQITVRFANLQTQGNEADIDGSVSAFVVKAVSTGTLKIGTSSTTATAWVAGTNDVIDATHLAYWTPAANANGTLNAFTVVAKDNSGAVSTSAVQAKVSVTNVNDLSTGAVTISGTATQGQVLTATNSLADIDGLGTVSYQWLANGTAISGATASTFTLTQAQVGKAINVKASYTDILGTAESKTSSATASVVNVNDAPTANNRSLTAVEDTARVLTVSDFGFADVDTGNTLQKVTITTLETKGALKLNGVDVILNQVITAADITAGKLIYTPATNANGTAYTSFGFKVSDGSLLSTAAYTATLNVSAVNDPPTGSVTISGTPVQGQILTAANILADVDGLGAVSYKWLANGVAITGATAATFTLTSAQLGKTLSVTATYTDAKGTLESKTSGSTLAVLNGTVTGTAGNDILMGSYAGNTLVGLAGNDVYYINHTGDLITEATNAGTDTVYSTLSTYTLASNVENGRIMSTGSANLIGNSLNNTLYAGSGINSIDGGTGVDTVSYVYASTAGTTGVTLDLGALNASSQATASGISGADLIKGIENITGSNYADILTGNSGANILTGGAGVDTLTGKLGNDTYVVALTATGALEDTISETSMLTTEIDTLKLTGASTNTAAVTRSLSGSLANIENLDISATGSSKLNLTGNAAANALTGNAAANTLNGGSGNDTLTGGAGVDALIGGLGNDTYIVALTTAGALEDTISETGVLSSEIDTLKLTGTSTNTTAVTRSLSGSLANIEHFDISATGSSKINLTGNAAANVLTGNSAANILNGSTGNDTLTGGLGHDSLSGGTGIDYFLFNTTLGSTNIDTLTDFVHGTDKIVLDDDIFKALGVTGTTAGTALTASRFQLGTTANDTADRIIYDQTSGKLYYDADGNTSGGVAAVQFALIGVSTHTGLTASDFMVAA